MLTFGEQLKLARTNNKLTLRDLAKKVRISHVFIGEVERGDKLRIGEKHWDRLAKALNVRITAIEEWNKACYCPCCDRLL